MLWTLKGMCLLLGLGVTMGACFALYATDPKEKTWKRFMILPGVAATGGAVYLIIEWLGPAGGGG